MNGDVVLKSKKGGYKDYPEIFSVGGYTFEVNGKSIPFDWNITYADYEIDEEGYILIEADLGDFEKEIWEDEYKEIGLSLEDITAELLLQVQKISEVYYECFEDEEEEKDIAMELVSFKINNTSIDSVIIEKYNDYINSQES